MDRRQVQRERTEPGFDLANWDDEHAGDVDCGVSDLGTDGGDDLLDIDRLANAFQGELLLVAGLDGLYDTGLNVRPAEVRRAGKVRGTMRQRVNRSHGCRRNCALFGRREERRRRNGLTFDGRRGGGAGHAQTLGQNRMRFHGDGAPLQILRCNLHGLHAQRRVWPVCVVHDLRK